MQINSTLHRDIDLNTLSHNMPFISLHTDRTVELLFLNSYNRSD